MEEARVNGFMLGTFEDGGEEFPGVVFGDDVVDLRTVVPGIGRIGDLFADWDAHLDALEVHRPGRGGRTPARRAAGAAAGAAGGHHHRRRGELP